MSATPERSSRRGAYRRQYALAAAIFWPAAGATVQFIDLAITILMGVEISTVFMEGVQWGLFGWAEWGLLAPAVVLAALSLSRLRAHPIRLLFAHAGVALLTSTIHSALFYLARTLILGRPAAEGESAIHAWVSHMDVHVELDLLVYALTVAAVYVALLLRRMSDEERARDALHERIVRAHLDLLKMRLPRDLLNDLLIDIESCATVDMARAEVVVSVLSKLLRAALTLTHAGGTLQHELALGKHFASAATLVGGVPLTIVSLLPEGLAAEIPATNLMLPILDAVRHDARHADGVVVTIAGHRADATTTVTWTIRGVRGARQLRLFAEEVRLRLPPGESVQMSGEEEFVVRYEKAGGTAEDESVSAAIAEAGASAKPPSHRPALAALLLLVPPAEAFFVSLLTLIAAHCSGRPLPADPFTTVWPAAASAPVGLLLATIAYRRRRHHERVPVLAGIAIAAVVGPLLCMVLASVPPAMVARQSEAFFTALRRHLLSSYRTTDFLIFSGIGVGVLAYGKKVASLERRYDIRLLDEELARTHAQALKEQLNPHFLFNALNSILALLDSNPAAATEMTVKLRAYLGLVMSMAERQEVSLQEELACTFTYLEIEQVRFGERLSVVVDIHPDALPASVPNLLLQPLIENAVKHGLEPIRGGEVLIRAHVEDERLLITVRDNGRGARSASRKEGIGLQNVRNRLRHLHGQAFAIRVEQQEQGYGVAIALPFRAFDSRGAGVR